MIRETIRKEGMVAIGKVVFTSREHIIALEPRGKGLLGTTLRYPYEVRNEPRQIVEELAYRPRHAVTEPGLLQRPSR